MSRLSFLRAIAALGAMTWALLVVTTPLLADTRSAADLGVRLATVAYVAGSFVCHQRPERSFHLHGITLPVCARCTGIYVGAAIGVLVALVPPIARRVRGLRAASWRRALVAAAVPVAISLAIEWLTPWPVSNLARAATGVVAGAAVAAFVIAVSPRA